jgi:uncharacterized damage-inducible protein DinB
MACLQAQYIIEPAEGYSTQIGIMVEMLEDLKARISANVQDLSQRQTDYMIDEKGNSIGALLMHIMATEAYTQVETLEGRNWTAEEAAFWNAAGELGAVSRAKIKGKPITYYLELWDEVRAKTLDGLKQRDDAWFASMIEEGMNYHWAWFHVLEHTANHMGQIASVKNRLPE